MRRSRLRAVRGSEKFERFYVFPHNIYVEGHLFPLAPESVEVHCWNRIVLTTSCHRGAVIVNIDLFDFLNFCNQNII